MSEIHFEYDQKSLSALNQFFMLFNENAKKALKNAINQTARKARTDLRKEATSQYQVKSGQVSGAMRLSSASVANLQANIYISGGVISVVNYHATTPKRGAKVAVKKGGLKELVGSLGIRGFRGPNNQVYQRQTAKRTPIKRISGPSVPSIMRPEGEIYPKVEPTIQSNLQKNVEAQIQRYL